MHTVIESLLKERAVVVTDGSWGTQLQKRGLARGECPDMWNLSKPEKVREVASLYVSAGSRVILTNTFGANRFVLGKFQAGGKVREINMAGVLLSKEAASGKALVFASIGPSGVMLVSGDVTEAQLAEAYGEQAEALAGAGADGLVVETMMDINEAVIAVRAAKATGLPVVASMVYDSGKAKDRTMMGNTPEQCSEALAASGADVIGANCGQGIEGFIPICGRLKAATGLPLWMKPNAGLPEMVNGEVVYRTGAGDFALHVPALVDNGARFIGGCCGTGADFIQGIIRALEG